MPHLVPAAKTLIRQVDERRPDASHAISSEVDGIGRIRSVEFDAKTSKWLAPILEACADPRIAFVKKNRKNRMTVTFVSTVKADHADPFALDEADAVLNG
jgi:hypothetical protein